MFKKTATFFKEVKIELKKVAWPSKDTVYSSTAIALTFMVFMAIFLWAEDSVLNWIMIKLFTSQ